MVVSKYTKNKAACQKFIDYLTNDKNQEKLYKDVQEVPANQNARNYAVKNGTELSKAVIEQFASADPMPNIPEMAEVWTGAENLVINAASGKKTPKQTADAAVKQISQSIEQKYKD